MIAADAGLGSVPLEVRVTRRWRGVDSKIQFRDASPPAKQRGHIYFGGEWRLLGPPKHSIGLPRPTTIRMIPPRRRSIGPNPTEASKPRATARGRRDRVEVRVAFGEHRVKGSAPDGDSESPPRQQAKAHGDRRGAGDRSVFPRGTDSSNPVPSSKESANHRFPRARQIDRRSDEASKPKPYLRAVLQVRIHLPPAGSLRTFSP